MCVLRGGSGTTATAETTTTEAWVEIPWSTTLLSSFPSSVSTLAVTTVTTGPPVITTHHSTWWGMAGLLLDVGSGDNLIWEMEPLAEVVNSGVGQSVVVVLPGELGLDVSSRVEGLEGLDDKEISRVNVLVLGEVEVLLGDENTLSEEVLVDLLAVSLGNKHFGEFAVCEFFRSGG